MRSLVFPPRRGSRRRRNIRPFTNSGKSRNLIGKVVFFDSLLYKQCLLELNGDLGQAALAEGCANNAVQTMLCFVHLNIGGVRETPTCCCLNSPITQTRNVCTSPRLRKRGMCLLFPDCANGKCGRFCSIPQTRNVCTSPRLRQRGMYVLLLDYANGECVCFCSITQTRNQKVFRTNSRTAGFRRPHLKRGGAVESFTGCSLKLRCFVR